MSSGRNTKRKNSYKMGNKAAIFTITVVVFSMAVVLHLRVSSLKSTLAGYQEKESQYTEQLADEENRAQTLEQYRIYVQTKQYIEKIAKEKLGLVNPDEILLKPES